MKGGAHLVRTDEADEDTGGSEEEPGVDTARQCVTLGTENGSTHATVMIIQTAKPRFMVMYLGAKVEISLPAA